RPRHRRAGVISLRRAVRVPATATGVTPSTRVTIAMAGISLVTGAAAAQQTRDTSGGRGRWPSRATIRAVTILAAVTLDGRLDEPFWATADSIDDFRQREPLAGSSATD